MTADRFAAIARLLLVLAYALLAHLASHRHDPQLAALALADIGVIVLLRPLLARRPGAWLGLVVFIALLLPLSRSPHALLPLLLVPVGLLGFVAWTFGRTLPGGRVPLITRMVAVLDDVPPAALAQDLKDYTRGLTLAWAVLLASMAVFNLLLALAAVPDGILAGLGFASPLPVTRAQWSWLANGINYGVVAGFFVLEFQYRKRRFPGRYHDFRDFLQRMAALGPDFWRDALR